MTSQRKDPLAQAWERRAPARPNGVDAELGLGAPREAPGAGVEHHKSWYSRGYLPHFDGARITHTITFRLKDSLPRHCLPALEQELAELTDDDERNRQRRQRIESLLDAGYGCCALSDPAVASIMQETLIKWHDDRYHLWAWCIMPNHVHALITARARLGKIVQSWKSFVARWARSRACELGLVVPEDGFWMREYWDRYIRDENHFAAAKRYVEHNPVAAGLCELAADWRWSSAHPSVSLARGAVSQADGSDAELGLGGPGGPTA